MRSLSSKCCTMRSLFAAASLLAGCCSSTSLSTRWHLNRGPGTLIAPSFHDNFPGVSNSDSSASAAASAVANQDGPRVCSLFLWDVASACRYHMCTRMLRDNLYEGLGGKKFVRIRPGSLLQSLFPCSDHAPDRCAICGFSFPEHLGEWWRPWLRSPYDDHLDQVREVGAVTPETVVSAKGRSWGWGDKQRKVRGNTAPTGWKGDGVSRWPSSVEILCFHRQYVQKVSPSLNDVQPAEDTICFDEEGYECRRVSSFRYRVPGFRPGSYNSLASNLQSFARAITIGEIESLLRLQEKENAKLQKEEDQKISM